MRLIDADTLRAEFTGNFQELWHYTGIWAMIDLAPTIETVPVVHGKWIYENCTWHCDQCGFRPFKGYIPETPGFNFCPNCSADMRKKVE